MAQPTTKPVCGNCTHRIPPEEHKIKNMSMSMCTLSPRWLYVGIYGTCHLNPSQHRYVTEVA